MGSCRGCTLPVRAGTDTRREREPIRADRVCTDKYGCICLCVRTCADSVSRGGPSYTDIYIQTLEPVMICHGHCAPPH